jgi:H/ACA ribonucleoprotein complex subunit 3
LRSLLSKCPKCGAYTMQAACPKCGSVTVSCHPAKYSPDDKYARYRNPLAYQDKTED